MMNQPPSEKPSHPPNLRKPKVHAALNRYWLANVRIMLTLLVIWLFAGLGCGVLWADRLNEITIGGYPLGFWFAQQGSIVVFVLLILIYALALNRLDRRHHQELQRLSNHTD